MKKRHENRVSGLLRPEILIVPVSLGDMVLACARNKTYAGMTAAMRTLDQWGRITSSSVVVHKAFQGAKGSVWGQANYEDFVWTMPIDAPAGESREWLDACAAADALRRAFPAEMWQLYLPMEPQVGGFARNHN